MTRLSFEQIMMRLACDLATRSHCTRMGVGAVNTSRDYRYIYGLGYNGQAAGISRTWDGNRCTSELGACGCLHAEENAIINCSVARSVQKCVFVTTFPCRQCAVRLINLGGVKRLFYAQDYRDMDASVELLDRAGILTTKKEEQE
jgi:dCMP deaminase